MSTPSQVFESLEKYKLPFNLRQCFDAFQLSMLLQVESACAPDRMLRVYACLNALTEHQNGRTPGQFFDPYRERRCLLEKAPPGNQISLLPMPSVIVEKFPAAPVAQIVDNEVRRIERYTADLDDEGVDVMGSLTALAFGSYDPPGGRAANIHFVAANVSWKVAQYLRDNPGPWNELPLSTVHFIDMQVIQRNRILKAEIDPPFRPEEIECFTEHEIRSFGASQQATYASPRCRHFIICPLCFVNLLHWQSYLADFLFGDSGGGIPTYCC